MENFIIRQPQLRQLTNNNSKSKIIKSQQSTIANQETRDKQQTDNQIHKFFDSLIDYLQALTGAAVAFFI